MTKRISLLSFLVLCAWLAMGQSFSLTTDALKIIQGSSVTATYTLDGASGSQFQPPIFEDFDIIGGPNRSTSMSIVNGAMSQTLSISYVLFPKKKGKLTIPPATIIAGGRKLTSNKIIVEVVKGQSADAIAEADKESFVRLEASVEEAILGQQITLEYKLYTQQDVNNYDINTEPDYDGFFSQDLRNYRSTVSREILNGKEYYTKILKKVALFPQRTGTFDFEPVLVTLAIPIKGARRTGGFFSSIPTRQIRVNTNALTLVVNDPPADAPISFSGAVGKYAMAVKLNKNVITTDDAFVINMEVRGTGDGKTFSAPQQPPVKNLEYYDPNVVRDEDTSRDGIVSNYKQIEYLIVPKEPGNYTIRPEFTYYDTDSNAYVTLAPQSFRVKVTQGNRSITADNRDLSIAENLRPSRESTATISPFMMRFADPFWYIGLLACIGGFAFIGYKKYKLDALNALDPAEKRRRKAIKLANAQLEKARNHQKNGETRKFYEEISATMNGYLGNKYGLPNTDFNKSKIIERLRQNNVSENNQEAYLQILKTCEMALFAGQPDAQMEKILGQCTELILSLEN